MDREGVARPGLIHRVTARLDVGGPATHVAHLARGMARGLDEGRPFRTRLVALSQGRMEELRRVGMNGHGLEPHGLEHDP